MGSFADGDAKGKLAVTSEGMVPGESSSSCSSVVLRPDSRDCAEACRSFGGTLRRMGGDGELGWLRYEVSRSV